MEQKVQQYQREYGIPAVCVAVSVGDEMLACVASGRRRADDPTTPATLMDPLIVGPVSKVLTSTMIVRLRDYT